MTSPGSGTSGGARHGHTHGHDDDASYGAAPAGRAAPGRACRSVPVPLPNNSLRYVFVYVFESDRRRLPGRRRLEHRRGLRRRWRPGSPARLRHGRRAGRDGHPHPPRPLRAGRAGARGVGGVGRPAPGRRRAHPGPLRRARRPARAGRRHAAPARGRPPRRSPRPAARRPCRCRRSSTPCMPDVLLEDGERPEVPGWDLSRHLDARPHARPPVLLGARQRAAAHRRPRAAPHHAQHVVPPAGGRQPAGRLPAARSTSWTPYEPTEVLPAHEHRFIDLHGRLEELRRHHAERFREVLRRHARRRRHRLGDRRAG